MAESTSQDLSAEIRALRRRVQWLERLVFRGIGVLSVIGLAGALVLPFWQGKVERMDEVQSLWLLSLPVAMTSAGTGPYRQEAWLAAAVVWVLIAAIVACACAVLSMAFAYPAPAVRRWHVIAIVVCALGLAGVWLLTFIMVGRSDGDMNVLSSGLLSLTMGVGLAIALWRLIESFTVTHR